MGINYQMRCPKSEQRSVRFPGIDQCEHCGKMVRTRRDGTYAKHNLPQAMARREYMMRDAQPRRRE